MLQPSIFRRSSFTETIYRRVQTEFIHVFGKHNLHRQLQSYWELKNLHDFQKESNYFLSVALQMALLVRKCTRTVLTRYLSSAIEFMCILGPLKRPLNMLLYSESNLIMTSEQVVL